jgi:transposase InsO family protein
VAASQAAAPADLTKAWAEAGAAVKIVRGVKLLATPPGDLLVNHHDRDLVRDILRTAHEGCGHGGQLRLRHNLLHSGLSWKGMYTDALQHVRSCPDCQMAVPPDRPAAHGFASPTGSHSPGATWFADFYGPLKPSEGKQYILVVMDACTRMVRLFPTASADGSTVVRVLKEQILHRYGYMTALRTDGGSHFDNELVKRFLAESGIKHEMGLPQHPSAQGMVERVMGQLTRGITATINNKFERWAPSLSTIEFALNVAVNRSLGVSPFEAFFGRVPTTQLDALLGREPAAFESLSAMRLVHAQLLERINLTADLSTARSRADRDAVRLEVQFEPGDYVLLHNSHRDNKLQSNWRSVCKVVKQVSSNVYDVREVNALPDATPYTVHVERLLPFDMSRTTERDVLTRALTDGQFMVDKVLDHEPKGAGVTPLRFKVLYADKLQRFEAWQSYDTLHRLAPLQAYLKVKGIASARPARRATAAAKRT